MAIHASSTTAPALQPRLLRPFTFRPTPPVDDPRSADDLLEQIRRTIEGQAVNARQGRRLHHNWRGRDGAQRGPRDLDQGAQNGLRRRLIAHPIRSRTRSSLSVPTEGARVKALRTTAGLALCVWWLPTIVLAFAPSCTLGRPATPTAGHGLRRLIECRRPRRGRARDRAAAAGGGGVSGETGGETLSPARPHFAGGNSHVSSSWRPLTRRWRSADEDLRTWLWPCRGRGAADL